MRRRERKYDDVAKLSYFGGRVQRLTITLDDALVAELDALIAARGYKGRSEALRDLARAGLEQRLLETDSAEFCVAVLVYAYDHEARELARRVSGVFHQHHDLTAATVHVPLNHQDGMEVALLKGRTLAVRQLAARVLAERGVRHGHLTILPTASEPEPHSHHGSAPHTHDYLRGR